MLHHGAAAAQDVADQYGGCPNVPQAPQPCSSWLPVRVLAHVLLAGDARFLLPFVLMMGWLCCGLDLRTVTDMK